MIQAHLTPLVLFAAAVFGADDAPTPTPAPASSVEFDRDVRPIFEARCVECHGPKKQKGKLRLDRRDSVFEAAADVRRVVPGKPAESDVVVRVSLPEDDPDVMPAEGPPLDPAEIEILRKWIEEGAHWPEAKETPGAKPTPAADKEPLRPDPKIELAPLDAEATARVEARVAALRERGASAVRIAQDTEALDVSLSLLGAAATDADAALLSGLELRLVWADLSRTSVTDAGLAALSGCTEIRRLSLASTGIGDSGLAHLAKLERLESLNLHGTAVTDAGLARLEALPSLRRLFLWRTAVSDAGVEKLLAARPSLSVDRGGYAEAMAKIAAAAPPPPTPVNANCPISGKPVAAGFVATHQGKTIGFCCGDCLAKFQANPDAFPLKSQSR